MGSQVILTSPMVHFLPVFSLLGWRWCSCRFGFSGSGYLGGERSSWPGRAGRDRCGDIHRNDQPLTGKNLVGVLQLISLQDSVNRAVESHGDPLQDVAAFHQVLDGAAEAFRKRRLSR